MTQNNDILSEIDEPTDEQLDVIESIREGVGQITLRNEFVSTGSRTPANGPCHRCESQSEGELVPIESGDTVRYICEECVDHVFTGIDDSYWYDRFRRSHYDIIAAYLRSLDEIWCVHDNAYRGAEMFVHTGHCSGAVLRDALTFMGSIYTVTVEHPDGSVWDCVDEHGPCIEFQLDFGSGSVPVDPISPRGLAHSLVNTHRTENVFLDDHDKLFDRED